MINKLKALVAVGCLATAPAAFALPFTVSVSYNDSVSGFCLLCSSSGEWGLFGPTNAGGLFSIRDGQTYTANRNIGPGSYYWEIGGAGWRGGTTWTIFANGQQVGAGSEAGRLAYTFFDDGTFSVPEPGTLALLGLGLLGIGFSVRRRQPEA